MVSKILCSTTNLSAPPPPSKLTKCKAIKGPLYLTVRLKQQNAGKDDPVLTLSKAELVHKPGLSHYTILIFC